MRLPTMLLVTASFLCLLPQPGMAASWQTRERAARKACLTGNPDKGVAILADLFIESEDLTYIFNQGRCFEQNRRYEDAIGRFREYLIKGERLKSADRAEAEKHIAACQSYLGKTAPVEPIAEPPKPALAPPTVAAPERAPALLAPATVAVTASQPPADAKAGRGLRIAGIAVAGVGAAALISGVALNLKANSMASDLEKPESYSRSTDSTRKDYKTLGWVGYGAGAALVATGGALYYFGWREGQAAALAVAPVVSTGMVGTVLTGAF